MLLYEENSNVQNLSLRSNQLDDVAAQNLSFGLGDIRRQNSKLLTLNLSCNQISDVGANCLARVSTQTEPEQLLIKHKTNLYCIY